MKKYIITAEVEFCISDEYTRTYNIYLGVIDADSLLSAQLKADILLVEYCRLYRESSMMNSFIDIICV